MSVEDLRKMRAGSHQGSFPGVVGKGSMYSQYPQYNNGGQYSKTQPNNLYYPQSNAMLNNNHMNQMDDMTRGYRGMNLTTPTFGLSSKPNPQMPTQVPANSGLPMANGVPQSYLYNGQLLWGNPYMPNGSHQGQNGFQSSPGVYNPAGNNFVGNGAYQTSYMNNSPSWNSSRVPSSDVPSLITPRRDSGSSNEHEVPGTPFTQYTGYGGMRGDIAVMDNSPNSVYWSTPSPTSGRLPVGKPNVTPISPDLQYLCEKEPQIPRAVPAPYSPNKPLDRALENPHGVTNVYIRGLQPNTTDEMLYSLACRFGDIVSSKSIIDHATGCCKG